MSYVVILCQFIIVIVGEDSFVEFQDVHVDEHEIGGLFEDELETGEELLLLEVFAQ